MSNAVYDKTKENLRNRDDIRQVKNKKDYLKWASKPSFIIQNIFDKKLAAIPKIKKPSLKNLL